MSRTLSSADIAGFALIALEDIVPSGHSIRKYSTAQRVLNAIAEIDGRPFDPDTGEFLEGGVPSIGKLQVIDAIEETVLQNGQLIGDFAYFTET